MPSDKPVGRTREIARMQAVFDAVAGASKRGAAVVGLPGQGKTVLLRYMQRQAADRGMLVAAARAPSAAGLPPLFPIGELLEGLTETAVEQSVSLPERLTRYATSLAADQPPTVPHLARALEELCRIRPVALFVDDFHWISAEGSAFLMAALRSVDGPITLVLASRPPSSNEASSGTLPKPTADLWLERIELEGLDLDSCKELAESTLGGPVLPSASATLRDATEGNPLHLIETIRNGLAEGWLKRVAGRWSIQDGFRARSVQEAIADRVSRLGGSELDVAGAMAVLARPATVDRIRVTTGLGVGDVTGALQSLIESGIATGDSAVGYRLAHPLYDVTLTEALGPVRRGTLHGAIFHMLQKDSAHYAASELAHHAINAHERPDQLAALLQRAAEECETSGMPVQAAAWYERLADEVPVGVERRDAVASAAKAAVRFSPTSAVELYTRALDGSEGPERARLLAGRAGSYRRLGRLDDDLRDLEAALPLAADEDIFTIEDGIAVTRILRGERGEALTMLTRLVDETVGTPHHSRALFHLAAARAYAGDSEGLYETSLRCLEESTDPHLRRSARNNVIWSQMLLGRWPEAEHDARLAITEYEQAEDYWNLLPIVSNAALLFAWKGDATQALDFAVRSEKIAERIGNPTDRLKALECVAVALLEGGEPSGAATLLSEVREILRTHAESREINYTYLVMGETQLALGDVAGADTYCREAEGMLATDSLLWAEAISRLRSEIALASGDAEGAVANLGRWLETPGAVALEHARAVEVAGRAMHRTGSRETGYAKVEEAHRSYSQLGAARRAGGAQAWLVLNAPRRLGRPRSSRPAGLTEREQEILTLIVRGKTNRQIADELVLSMSTVKKHVEHVLAKAGVSRRSELAGFALRIGMTID